MKILSKIRNFFWNDLPYRFSFLLFFIISFLFILSIVKGYFSPYKDAYGIGLSPFAFFVMIFCVYFKYTLFSFITLISLELIFKKFRIKKNKFTDNAFYKIFIWFPPAVFISIVLWGLLLP